MMLTLKVGGGVHGGGVISAHGLKVESIFKMKKKDKEVNSPLNNSTLVRYLNEN